MPASFPASAAAWVLSVVAAVACAADAPPPNVVLILADDLGINDLGCYGRRDQPTPHLDRLASEGIRFTNAYCAQPICSPSRAALLTGKSPARLHLTTFLPGRADAASQKLLHPAIAPQLPLAEVTLAERLQQAGYATGCFGKWHLGGAGFGPREQGFDVYAPGSANTPPSATEGGKGEFALTAQACDFIRAQRERPFFAYLAHNTPHIPLGAKPDLVAKHRAAFHPAYAAMIESLDNCVGQVLTTLAEAKLTERTIVIFTSDNGGLHVRELNETPVTHNTPFRAGKGFVYEGGLRVPTIVRWPGKLAPAGNDQPWINTDLPATLLGLAGLPHPPEMDGVDLTTEWQGKVAPAERTLYWHFPHYTNQGSRPAGAVRQGAWKLIEHYEDGATELYDVVRDPGEANNQAADQPQVVAALRGKLHAWRKEVGAQENRPNPNFDPAAHRRLYLDFDASRIAPAATSAALAEGQRAWREGIDAAVRRQK